MAIIGPLLLIALTCIIIWRASDGFETASEYVGRNLSDGVRGATINAIASSMPELFTTIFFLFVLADKDGFAAGIGTTAGSAIFNGMIIPAFVILVALGYGVAKRIEVSRKVILRDGLALIACETILVFLISGTKLMMWHGIVLMLLYAAYIVLMFSTMSKNKASAEEEEEEEEEERSSKPFLVSLLGLDLERLIIPKSGINDRNAWVLLVTSTLVIGSACLLLVHSCEHLGDALGIRLYFIAVVVASMATSVPDTIISIRDSMKGNYNDAVANALGSNIFDICFALGFPLFLYTVCYGSIEMGENTVNDVTELRLILLFMTIIAFLIYFIGKSMGRPKAFMLLGLYIIFFLYILGSAYQVPWVIELGVAIRSIMPG